MNLVPTCPLRAWENAQFPSSGTPPVPGQDQHRVNVSEDGSVGHGDSKDCPGGEGSRGCPILCYPGTGTDIPIPAQPRRAGQGDEEQSRMANGTRTKRPRERECGFLQPSAQILGVLSLVHLCSSEQPIRSRSWVNLRAWPYLWVLSSYDLYLFPAGWQEPRSCTAPLLLAFCDSSIFHIFIAVHFLLQSATLW